MRKVLTLLCLTFGLLGACTSASQPTTSVQQGGSCGDGICDGPENAQSCPRDCSPPGSTAPLDASGEGLPPAIDVPPVYFFYAIHTHVSDDKLPYDASLTEIDAQVAKNMLAAVEGIREILDRYGIPGSWQVTYGVASGLCDYGGENHVLKQLIDDGHEVAVHAHRTEDITTTYEALTSNCGITAQVGSGHLLDAYRLGEFGGAQSAQDSMTLSLSISSDQGVTITTENLSPGGNKNPFDEACNSQFGVGNTMWEQSGNLMFPWRPDYQNGDICTHNSQSDIVFIDHVSPEFALSPAGGMPDIWTDMEFAKLQQFFDGALAYMQSEKPDRLAVWGFATHITEYAFGANGEQPPASESLEALDQFLAYIDSKHDQGLVVYATPSQIAALVEP
jgi:hypothetical protein